MKKVYQQQKFVLAAKGFFSYTVQSDAHLYLYL